MKIETATITGRLLNFWTAKALKYSMKRVDREEIYHPASYQLNINQHGWLIYNEHNYLCGYIQDEDSDRLDYHVFSPSTEPAQGFPLIHEHKISLLWEAHDDFWSAHEPEESYLKRGGDFISQRLAYDAEPLVAAMRCLVMMKIGLEVEE